MKQFIFILMLLGFSGCTIVDNLDEISTLGQYSREKDAQHRDVKAIDDHYDALAKAIDQGHITDFKDQASFKHSFGEPITIKELPQGHERWLYRYAIYRLATTKVYLYFDRAGRLLKWEKIPCQKFF